jgi:stage II sporulation SpoAA-like protein
MPMTMRRERDNVYCLEVRGLLHRRDLDHCQDQLFAELDRVGPVRLLFLLQEFEGWAPQDDWRDLTFYVKHGDAIERIAIVGHERWRGETMMFAGADLRKAPVEFFPETALAEARAWLAAPQLDTGTQRKDAVS